MMTSPFRSDGEKGELRFRGMRIEDLFRDYDFDTTMYLLIWGHLPTPEEKERFEYSMAAAASPPQAVVDAIRALPYACIPYLERKHI